MATKGGSNKTKWIAGGVLVCAAAAAITLGLIFGLKDDGGSSKSSSAGGKAAAAGTLVERCGELLIYPDQTRENVLQGSLENFAYGPLTQSCCAADYACPYAAVTTYKCSGGTVTYEMQCCTSRPVGSDYSSCKGAVYRSSVSATATARTVRRDLATCTPSGMVIAETCTARTAEKGVKTTLYSSRIAPLPAATTATPTPTPTDAVGKPTEQATTTPEPTEAGTKGPVAATEAPETVEPTQAVVGIDADGNPVYEDPAEKEKVDPYEGLPDDEVCTQATPPPGVKVNSCLQVICKPDGVAIGEPFHTTIRWCIQRPRDYHVHFNMLDMKTKTYYTGDGYDPAEMMQCGEHTFKLNMDVERTPSTGQYDIMWKWFLTPYWGTKEAGTYKYDVFPNMLAETGIGGQPDYNGLVNDCQPVPDRSWNLKPTGMQDAIQFDVHPPCITVGADWTFEIKTHLESRLAADLHINMQIGTGGDKYLGTDDKYVDESNIYNLLVNGAANYWTTSEVTFTGAQTAKLAELNQTRVYIAAFLVPHLQEFGQVPEGWTMLEREFYLQLAICGAPGAAE